MEDIVFDTANKNDIDELVRLRIAYIRDDFGSISDEEELNLKNRLPGYFERELGDHLIAFVARAEGRLVAAAYLLIVEKPANPSMPTGLCGEVLSVFTEESYRGKGICSHLMTELVTFAKERGFSRIDLLATEDGYHVYKKLGFEENRHHYKEMRLKL